MYIKEVWRRINWQGALNPPVILPINSLIWSSQARSSSSHSRTLYLERLRGRSFWRNSPWYHLFLGAKYKIPTCSIRFISFPFCLSSLHTYWRKPTFLYAFLNILFPLFNTLIIMYINKSFKTFILLINLFYLIFF